MKTSTLAAVAAVLLAAVPAVAAENAANIETSPVLGLADRAPALDTGSAQYQRGDGPAVGAAVGADDRAERVGVGAGVGEQLAAVRAAENGAGTSSWPRLF